MTRFEKEKILLMCLGLSEGDKITFTDYNSKVNGKVIFEIRYDKEVGNFKLWSATDEVKGWLYITDLIKYNFKKVKTLGSKNCYEVLCKECPFYSYPNCCMVDVIDLIPSTSLYGRLEYFKDRLDNECYNRIKNALDKEVDNAKETNE